MPALTYLNQVGPPPPAWTFAWRNWYYSRLNYLTGYCNQPRAATYYVSNSTGADTNAGTQAAPWKTIAKAQANMAANTAFLFLAGDEWNETVGLNLAANVTVGRYGNGANPFFNAFNRKITAGWTLTAGTTWQVTAVANVALFRLTGLPQPQLLAGLSPYFVSSMNANKFPLWSMSTLAACEANIGTWYFNSATNVISFNTGISVTAPPPCEYCITGTLSGITVPGVDGCYVQSIRADGWGSSGVAGAGGNSERMPFLAGLSGTQVVCFDSCEAFFSDAHLIGLVEGSAIAGGIFVTRDCRFGFAVGGAGGSAPIVSYNYSGGQETYYENLTSEAGSLPPPSAAIPAGGYYVQGNANVTLWHSSNGSPTSVSVCRGLRLRQQSRSLSYDNSSNGNPPLDYGIPANCLTFFVDTDSEDPPDGVVASIGVPPLKQPTGNVLFLNCRWKDQFSPIFNGYAAVDVTAMGHLVNCEIVLENVTPIECYSMEAAAPPTYGSQFLDMHFSRIIFRGYWSANSTFFTKANAILIANSDFVNGTPTQGLFSSKNIYGTGVITMAGNAYTSGGFLGMADATAITANSIHSEKMIPGPGSALFQSATTGVSGAVYPEFDIDWNPRNRAAPNVGPYEITYGAVQSRGFSYTLKLTGGGNSEVRSNRLLVAGGFSS